MNQDDLVKMVGELLAKTGELKATVESGQKESVRRHEEHGRALQTMATEIAAHGKRLADVEAEQKKIRRDVTTSAHDLSEHIRKDEENLEAIKRHTEATDKGLAELQKSTDGQNRKLSRIDLLHPTLIILAAIAQWIAASRGTPLPAQLQNPPPALVAPAR